MSLPRRMPQLRHVLFSGAALVLACGFACAQTDPSHNSTSAAFNPASESSSSSAPVFDNASVLASFPAASAEGGGGQGSSDHHGMMHHLAFEAGGGFNGPSSDSSNYITWGGNFTVGGGFRFNPHIAALLEYQFIGDKLPGALIAETGAQGGDAHIWSLTAAPVIDVFPKSKNDVYITGGGGFYRKVTEFTDPEEYCEYFYCGVENETVGHFSSNQGGWSIGGGFTHRIGGVYGDGTTKIFAEVRYLDVMTPVESTQPNGLGTVGVAADTKLIPVTLGLRW